MIPADLAVRDRSSLRVYASTTSTNDIACDWARADAPDGATVVADTQSAGRGRRGRSWYSPPGVNLYLSQIVRAPLIGLRLAPLMGGLSVRACIHPHLPTTQVAIKWPNDILADGYKVAGILCELLSDPRPAAVVGIGVNINMTAKDFPSGLRRPASSLRMLAAPVDRQLVLTDLLKQLDVWRATLQNTPEKLVAAFVPHCLTLGRKVRVSPPGRQAFLAVASDIDEGGRLLVIDQRGKRLPVEAGDVDFEEI